MRARSAAADPPIVEVDGEAIPFKADGTAGDRCAGWAARRRLSGLDGLVVADMVEMAAESL